MPKVARQANDEDMVAHDAADAGASLTRPELAGQIKKGGFILMDKKHPCEVLEIKHSKTGKHGKAKCRETWTSSYLLVVCFFPACHHVV